MRVKKSTRLYCSAQEVCWWQAGAGAIGASTTIDLDGNNRVLSGSDALKALSNDILTRVQLRSRQPDHHGRPDDPGQEPRARAPTRTGTAATAPTYTGGGQSVGDSAIAANTQQLGVGTASLKNSTYAYAAATGTAVGSIGWINADGDTTTNGANAGAGAAGRELPIQGTTETLIIGLDGLTILGNTAQTAPPNGLAVQGAQLTVHHYVPSDARSFAAAGSGGSVVATTKTWTLPGVTFASTDVGAKIAVAGASNAGNNNIFTISAVTHAVHHRDGPGAGERDLRRRRSTSPSLRASSTSSTTATRPTRAPPTARWAACTPSTTRSTCFASSTAASTTTDPRTAAPTRSRGRSTRAATSAARWPTAGGRSSRERSGPRRAS